ncbi:MAG TPA: exosortase/archaeosortase family protein [Acidobacteriota bacterium]|nr:exosortase/archaeosortase family protein [Acidobacteriota bacterium]
MFRPHKPTHRFFIFTLLLIAAFSIPFYNLIQFALHTSLFSHILIVPLISGYIAWQRRGQSATIQPGPVWSAIFPALIGVALLAAAWAIGGEANVLSLQMLSFCCLLLSGGIFFLGFGKIKVFAFPALFLFFIAPIPAGIIDRIETVLQYASAEVSYRFIKWSGIPVFRSGIFDFEMPGIAFRVAQECSGIRSTLVLFLTSLVAGNMLLRATWSRWALVLLVFPLGVVRNAFRILTLAILCVHIDPAYIHSPIHTRGGPIFFILSLVVFGAILLLLRRMEGMRRKRNAVRQV